MYCHESKLLPTFKMHRPRERVLPLIYRVYVCVCTKYIVLSSLAETDYIWTTILKVSVIFQTQDILLTFIATFSFILSIYIHPYSLIEW